MKTPAHHLTLSGQPYCQHLGCMAGVQLAKQTGVDLCSYRTLTQTKQAAAALRSLGHKVEIILAPCPAS